MQVERFGRDKLFEAPAWKIEELQHGGIWIQVWENPFHCPKPMVQQMAEHAEAQWLAYKTKPGEAPVVTWRLEKLPAEGQRSMAKGLMNQFQDHTGSLEFNLVDINGVPYNLG